MVWFWVAAAIGFLALELSTLKMIFALFALSAGSCALAKVVLPTLALKWQLLIFILAGAFLVLVVRPLLIKAISKLKKQNK